MKVFIDMEFIDLNTTYINGSEQIISIGLIDENGREFYKINGSFDALSASDFVRENLIPNLERNPRLIADDYKFFKSEIEEWFEEYKSVEIWGDCLAFDWVLFCNLFGGGFNCIPKQIYYIPFDICTVFKLKGLDPDISREEFAGMKDGQKHNALWDAKVIKACYEKLMGE